MRLVQHTITGHAALRHVFEDGRLPKIDRQGRNLLRDTILRLMHRGAVNGAERTGARISLSPLGAASLTKWEESRCTCFANRLTSRETNG